MKLLITTQILDRNDPILGFFHRWVEEFANHCEEISVICLKEGNHALPPNVRVYSLGKEQGTSRLTRAERFVRYIVQLRGEYDAVFVHMNPEYVVLGGWLWRLWHKKVVLWYMHRSVDVKLRIAEKFVDAVATASPESFRLASDKVHIVGHGIDTDFFSPEHRSGGAAVVNRVLSAGRLSPSKHHELIIRACTLLPQVQLSIAGSSPVSTEQGYEESLYRLVEELGMESRTIFLGARTQTQMREVYATADIFAHASTTGSLDKVVLEALAMGVPVVSTNDALKDMPGVVYTTSEPESFAKQITRTLTLPNDPQDLAAYVRENHSLKQCINRIIALYTA